MPPLAQFLDRLRAELPAHRRLVDSLAEAHAGDIHALMQACLEHNLLSHPRLCQLWADVLGVAYVNPFNVELPSEPAGQLPVAVARQARAIVLNSLGGAATVALATPEDARLVASLAKALHREISPVYAHPSEINALLDLHFGTEEALAGSLQEVCDRWPTLEGGRELRTSQDAAELVQTQAFATLFNSILLTAFRRRASDIHFESGAHASRVRLRVDGDMVGILDLPHAVHEAMIVRIKVLCGLDVAQTRLPQDGAFEINFGGRRPAFRAATMPSLYGEKGVLRLLGSLADQGLPRLSTLGFADSGRQALRRAILSPNGILLVCGPTGSGKTTTLYGCLNEINRPDLNVVTIEDPVEYRLPGASQHQVNAQIGLTFAGILRGVLRQDPDVLLIGEIRDGETARIATEAALTGHLVMSSLHTNNSLQAVTRLIELGVEPHLVAPTLMGVMSQRLVRRLCSSCKEAYLPSAEELAPYFHNPDAAEVSLFRARGCPACHGTGYHGRVGVHEILEVSEPLRELILTHATPSRLAREARRTGYRPMRYDALKKVLLGWTTLEEVERNTLPEFADAPVSE